MEHFQTPKKCDHQPLVLTAGFAWIQLQTCEEGELISWWLARRVVGY
jgi:hypothetical protein